MLRSLWSGVSGMQAHQIALDVESNNIANVNTVGFKYSRASFVDMLSQVKLIATSPYKNGLGGMNDFSVGLGVSIDATTKVFSQGNTQNTDVKTDIAIEGDGFFIISPDRGTTHNYTRNGEFLFDANGNLVTTGGYVVQGWVRGALQSEETANMSEYDFFRVDNTGPVRNIQVDPGMVMPARTTSTVTLRANLNAGRRTEAPMDIAALDSTTYTSANGEEPMYDSRGRMTQVGEDLGVLFNGDGDAFALNENQGIWVSYKNSVIRHNVVPTDEVSTISINGENISFSNDSGLSGMSSLLAAQNAINGSRDKTGIEAYVDNGVLRLENRNMLDGGEKLKNIRITKGGTGVFAEFKEGEEDITAFRYRYTFASDADSTTGQFRTTEDLRALMQYDANMIKNPEMEYKESTASVSVTVNNYGMFEILNKDDGTDERRNLNIYVSAHASGQVTSNVLFKETMRALNSSQFLEGGTPISSGKIYKSTHATSVDIVDSLGTKHNLRFEFWKTGPAEWNFRAVVPEPAQFLGGTAQRPNIFEGGRASFNSDGSLAGMNPPVVQLDPKNGSNPIRIELKFGANQTFGGLTSVDKVSETYAINQNGYQAGDLMDIRFDSNGTLLGSFSNGKSIALAQVAMANFANSAGLQAEGGNVFSQTGNSGEPMIGAANTGRRGGVSGSKLEMSNVDLSRSLTQLIVVQRGFQANSKAVTTSDQILNTLLNLKQ